MSDPFSTIGSGASIISLLMELARQRRKKNQQGDAEAATQDKLPVGKLRPALPRPIGYIQRPQLLAEILRPPTPQEGVSGPEIAAIFLLHGMGGIGKTELARAIARELKPANGVAEVDLRGWGSDQPMAEDEAIRALCAQTTPAPAADASLETLRAHWQEVTSHDHVVVILDNLKDEGLIDKLRPASGLTIITSRNRIVRTGIQPFAVDVMELPEAVALAKANLTNLEDNEAERLVKSVGRLPLAIEVAAGYLAESGEDTGKLIQRIGEAMEGEAKPEERTLEGLFQRVVALSIADMPAELVSRWQALSLPPSDFGLWTVQALWKADNPALDLAKLTRRNLVTRLDDQHRWAMHDLLRHYSRAALAVEVEREQELWRWLGVVAVGRLVQIEEQFKDGGPDALPALAELDTELPLLRALLEWAAANLETDNVGAFLASWVASTWLTLSIRVPMEELKRWLLVGLKAAENRKEIREIAIVASNLGLLYRRLGEWNNAISMHYKCLDIVEKMGNTAGVATKYGNIGAVYRNMGKLDKALEMHTKSLRIHQQLGSQVGIARQYGNLGATHMDGGQPEDAIKLLRKGLPFYERIGDVSNMA